MMKKKKPTEPKPLTWHCKTCGNLASAQGPCEVCWARTKTLVALEYRGQRR